ncbi:baseplate J/gp47 family protein, partial [Stenotrophomonas maltophilia]
VWEVFGRLKWMDRQRFAMTATGDELERHGADYGISRKPASYSQGNVVVVADTWPLTVAQGTVFTRSDG